MLEFRRNGRKMSSQQFFDGIKRDILAKAEGEVERRLPSLRDPETGQPVRRLHQRGAREKRCCLGDRSQNGFV